MFIVLPNRKHIWHLLQNQQYDTETKTNKYCHCELGETISWED